jgi:hypothetical protein
LANQILLIVPSRYEVFRQYAAPIDRRYALDYPRYFESSRVEIWEGLDGLTGLRGICSAALKLPGRPCSERLSFPHQVITNYGERKHYNTPGDANNWRKTWAVMRVDGRRFL